MVNSAKRDTANALAFEKLTNGEPVLIDVAPAVDVMPGMTENTVLTSGPPLPWADYTGGQREALIGGALYEGLANSRDAAIKGFENGGIRVGGCHDFGGVGSLAGIYTASMPVFVVENRTYGNVGYCNMYEGKAPKRLNYGVYDSSVHERLKYIDTVIAPVIASAVRQSGGIPLNPIMKRALNMGDELHSRNTAASLIFARELFPHLLDLDDVPSDSIRKLVDILTEDHYFFLRLSMAAAKSVADAAHGVEGSSLVTAMCFSCKEFGIKVSGLGDDWIRGPHATINAKLFDGHTEDEITWMGGESPITETIGLGGFAQAASFPLQDYQGGDPQAMVERNLELYKIVHGENPTFKIPFLKFRGTPTGIDVFKVAETGILPMMDIGIAGAGGGQIGAGTVRAPLACFAEAVSRFK
ncbi:MAG: DUF1116 domain-containing protein [Alphaproteobacteria bacterium]